VTSIPGPILLVVLPLAAAGVTYLVRRLTIVAALLAAATTGVLAFLCLRLPLDRSAFVLGQEVVFGRPVVVLGQTLQLDPAGRLWLAYLFGLATIFFLFAWLISQGRSFFSFGLAILALYALVVLLQAFSLAVLVFGFSTTLAVFILQGGQRGSVRGAQRYLLVSLLAVPFLLAAAWMVEPVAATGPGTEMVRRALLPIALGFGLLLAVFPFGTWMPAVAADAPPVVAAFVFTGGQAMALYLALLFLRDHPVVASDPAAMGILQLAGLVTCVSGGIMAMAQRDFGRLFGYAALSDMGVLLLALTATGSQSTGLTLLHVAGRSISITLVATSLAIVRHRATTDRFPDLNGVARRLPLVTMGLALGVLALAGFPLTAGFPIHWAVYRAVSSEQWLWTLLLVATSAAIIVGLLRGLHAMLGADAREEVTRPPVLASLLVLALAVLTIVLGLYPQMFLEPVRNVGWVFSLF
jgi:NADH-quinone oxidoreductase subunit N